MLIEVEVREKKCLRGESGVIEYGKGRMLWSEDCWGDFWSCNGEMW